ncbi:MAG: glycosyltransferase [Clostridiales Family XIII bacterium]|jgi:glycosyltransferase involved in cell wall biosynthesis|nr:glycosyltransferase [Clostridiales Family XIII bacterium]
MENILVSVVVAVYNAEPYLCKCLDTVLGQTLREIEVICVDDGSTDESLRILREYEQKDQRVRVISQKHADAGAGPARNAGLEVARGKYLSFLDADDFFDTTMLEKTVRKAEQCQADIVLFDAYSYDHKTGALTEPAFILNKAFIPNQDVFTWKDVPDNIFRICIGAAWNMLCGRDFVFDNRLRFQAVHHADDMVFAFSALIKARRITVLNEKLLYYRQNNASSQSQTKSHWPDTAYLALREVKARLSEYGMYDEVRRSFVNRGADYLCWYLDTMASWESFRFLWLKLKDSYFSELDISGHASDYFYESGLYEWRERIMRQEPEEWIFAEYLKSKSTNANILHHPLPAERIPKGSRIALYGAGTVGKAYFAQCLCMEHCKIVLWADRRAESLGYPVERPERLRELQCDAVLIAIADQKTARQIRDYLIDIGIDLKKIIYGAEL